MLSPTRAPGYLNSTPEQARAKLDKLMATDRYKSGNRLAIFEVQILSRMAHPGAATPATQEQILKADALKMAEKRAAAPAPPPAPAAAPAPAQSPAAELRALLKTDSPMFNANHPKHKEAVARFQTLSRRG